MKLRPSATMVLFALGACAGLIGDHGHVATGTTEYFTRSVPYLWSSPVWFPVMVGAATVALGELRLHLPRPRVDVSGRQAVAGIAAVVGSYVVTALVHAAPPVPATVLICVLAALTWCVLGDGPALVCGLIVAVLGPIVEVVLVQLGVFRYAASCAQLFGVGPWLVPLYFAFGVVAAMLGEFAARSRHDP